MYHEPNWTIKGGNKPSGGLYSFKKLARQHQAIDFQIEIKWWRQWPNTCYANLTFYQGFMKKSYISVKKQEESE